jgi:hypothetical protein
MNKKRLPLVLIALLAIAAIDVPLAILNTSCSSPGLAAHKTGVVTMPTVNVAMGQWKDFVTAGKATQAQVDSVKTAYKSYYDAEVIAKGYEITWINSKSSPDQSNFTNAAADASTKGAGVVALITTYMTVK